MGKNLDRKITVIVGIALAVAGAIALFPSLLSHPIVLFSGESNWAEITGYWMIFPGVILFLGVFSGEKYGF